MKMIIPPKPEDATWTDDQWKAIMAKGQDILVAAAAGSGKTAVLVERIINKIIADEDPINVDELLVVTFTNASAAEMRHRIGEALEKAINDNPRSAHLRKQVSLLNRASISTLHSFCLEMIRKYYYMTDIDPGFRIADETEAQLLRDEVLEELFEEEYGKEGNEGFFALVDTFTNDRSDTALQDIIRDLYDFARSNPSPDQYLDSIVEMYNVDGVSSLEQLPFVRSLLEDIDLQLKGAKQLLEYGLELTKLPGGPAPRAENFIADLHVVNTLIEAKKDSWTMLYEAMQSWSFGRAKTCKGDEYDEELVEKAKKLRDQAKKIITGLQEELFFRRQESFMRDMAEMKPHIEELVSLVKAFSIRFEQIKTEKGLVDFADLEHYCLEILSSPDEEGRLLPSDAALVCRNQFKEVLVDEYQDTNMVQEAILQLVTADSEENGNLFMVGDVKQSIYRFRLAEPNLFLGKYTRFDRDGERAGLRIDLARNFRSRKEVLQGTNYIFKQIMGTSVGEIEYDQAAELIKGAPYSEDQEHPVELAIIDLEGNEKSEPEPESMDEGFDSEDLAQSQLEARYMASKIKEIIGNRQEVYNTKTHSGRPAKYRDIVILLRSMTWAPQIMEEFKQQGIPVYANLSSGYFEATEVAIMMSLLKVIDNPYQDIPLASVLRSPILGLTEEELAQIRIHNKRGSFYEALTSFCRNHPTLETGELYEKVRPFFDTLEEWRVMARQGSLSELIWHLYRETRFYDFVGGMPGGKQRQANLRALYDRARQYEATSFRGLFRFLRFIERMRDRGDDLGAARALGEQEDVVRLMTIHSSKGLEFPFVFIAGLARSFNTMDLKKPYMLDKEFGFAAKYVNAEKRISYPSLPQITFKRKKKMEMLAEEMRVLYVALTRAKEKLYLVSSVKSADKKLNKWLQASEHKDWLLNEYDRASATSYLDWIGPALVRHRECEALRGEVPVNPLVPGDILEHPSCWNITIIKSEEAAVLPEEVNEGETDLLKLVYEGKTVPAESAYKDKVEEQLSWKYSFKQAAQARSKQSVSEVKRQREIFSEEDSGTELIRKISKPMLSRPRFMQEKSLSPAERGTAMHAVMQHIDFSRPATVERISSKMDEMVHNELLTEEQRSSIEPQLIVQFFETELGQRIVQAKSVRREVPFSLSFPAREIYSDWQGEDEPVLIQGIVDCVFEDEHGLVLLDYKTDGISGRFKGGFAEARPVLENRYKIQIDMYTRALEQILKREVNERYLFFFDGAHTIKL
ncbi:helicase-exonuclease AddAB subunit AddA [Cytobacillus firmus]|uniref:helicase-exonuclease AddAB subunit AddA n=2 Tax=Cytobacillus firmus TaxID=1399 RepID=UPI0018CCE597|nr:helicase-exonuclease AddAB subunit AddA [Cytobacillus firmus]MBG9547935.1 ATP-dependent helicase [Cytobacillus firmus]MBG9603909.1 ATP-dependent helicase [Cytobacillus firmus]MBG9655060.1 ATP-dependent helicase [Cytobacillus firmus]MED1907939.1 helicase-exonuclease AddAB subunit AddA [Cytobacillus firmus]MED1939118.1 helicase-exonuclease AddAB subunit AddA [Cytobacillus firmus]